MYASKVRHLARVAAPLARSSAFKTQFSLLMNSAALKQQNALIFAQSRAFASFDTIQKASSKLDKALDGEIKYEQENYTQIEDIEQFLNQSGFKFSESNQGIKMVLKKEVGDKVVEVHFDAR